MTDQEIEEGKFLEAFTLHRDLAEPVSPLFNSFSQNYPPRWWNWWGGPWSVNNYGSRKKYPDIIYTNNEGKRHRIYGPAYISRTFGIEAWYKDNKLHREDGPAYSHAGNYAWFYEGQLHRLDGPAVDEQAGPKQYWIYGIRYSKKQYKWEIKRRTLKDYNEKQRSRRNSPEESN